MRGIESRESLPSSPPLTPVRKNLWLAGVGAALFILTLVIGNNLIDANRAVTAPMLGHDFLAFYTAGTAARQGRVSELYDLDATRAFQEDLARREGLDVGNDVAPFWNPPFVAWALAPLSMLPYRTALVLWVTINLAALAGAVVLLCRMLGARDWHVWGLVPLLIGVCIPFIQTVSHAQNTFISLLILAAAVALWRQRRALPAGLVAGSLFYKPQLGVVVAFAMMLMLGRRALLGLGITGGLLLLVTLVLMPGAISDYLVRLPENVRVMQIENTYMWERHVTFKAFWRLLLQGRGAAETSSLVATLTFVCNMTLIAGLLVAFRRLRLRSPLYVISPDRLIAATICAMPLLMPFYFDYDLLLLAVPAVLLAGEILGANASIGRYTLWPWAALFIVAALNPVLAGHTRVNLSVVVLTVLAGQSIVRACRRDEQALAPAPGIQPLAAAA